MTTRRRAARGTGTVPGRSGGEPDAAVDAASRRADRQAAARRTRPRRPASRSPRRGTPTRRGPGRTRHRPAMPSSPSTRPTSCRSCSTVNDSPWSGAPRADGTARRQRIRTARSQSRRRRGRGRRRRADDASRTDVLARSHHRPRSRHRKPWERTAVPTDGIQLPHRLDGRRRSRNGQYRCRYCKLGSVWSEHIDNCSAPSFKQSEPTVCRRG